MTIKISCKCGKQLRVKDELAGKRIRCPDCRNFLTVYNAASTTAKPDRDKVKKTTPPQSEEEEDEDENHGEESEQRIASPAFFLIVGFLLQIGGNIVIRYSTFMTTGRLELDPGSPLYMIGYLIILLGLGIFAWGCARYAQSKGHSPAWGLFGLCGSCCGFFVIWLVLRHVKAPHDATDQSESTF